MKSSLTFHSEVDMSVLLKSVYPYNVLLIKVHKENTLKNYYGTD